LREEVEAKARSAAIAEAKVEEIAEVRAEIKAEAQQQQHKFLFICSSEHLTWHIR
jgi:hypothetical protein